MSQIQFVENHGLNSTYFKSSFEKTHSNTNDLEIVLHRLYHRENEIFNRIVLAIRTNDNTHAMILASELIRIRVLKRNLCVALELVYHHNTKYYN